MKIAVAIDGSENALRAAKHAILLDNSDGLLLVYDEENEASPKFLKKEAESKKENANYQIITVNFNDLQDIIEEENARNYL
ncbi:hypothetical protein BEP19_00500 [Ammoniphilus oxalaticus]|uniref:UspA domain-containing protein n=1 Tax=Ammoniphilus oxalaticus TaxID=66863 RepID=A0A419SRA9_9BACL|nr:SLOG family protein [Ammoniphilus oxalaticus]RKD27086.1 hypothetical protein BEP19_00500 [Ammoniphilus oxalaticus]